jgi:hypothetical protein
MKNISERAEAGEETDIGCLRPVRSDEDFQIFVDRGGAESPEVAKRQMEDLVEMQLGDFFLAKDTEGAILTWIRVKEGGGGRVEIRCGDLEEGLVHKVKKFVEGRRASNRLYGCSWMDERGRWRPDDLRIHAKFRDFAGLSRRKTLVRPARGGRRRGGAENKERGYLGL